MMISWQSHLVVAEVVMVVTLMVVVVPVVMVQVHDSVAVDDCF